MLADWIYWNAFAIYQYIFIIYAFSIGVIVWTVIKKRR